jgi:hypothetical protein
MKYWILGTFGNWFYISKFDNQTIKDTHESGGFFIQQREITLEVACRGAVILP